VSEEERRDLTEDEQDDDVEAHRKSSEAADDGDDADDVEAHRQHGSSRHSAGA
jgi:hypothetical protein